MPANGVHRLLLVPGDLWTEAETLRERLTCDDCLSMDAVRETDLVGIWSTAEVAKEIVLLVSGELRSGDKEGIIRTLNSEAVRGSTQEFTASIAPLNKADVQASLDLYCELRHNGWQMQISYVPPPTQEYEPEFGFLGLHYDVAAISERISFGEHGLIPQDLFDEVVERGLVPEKFWYWDEESATLWNKLALPESSYDLVKETTALVKDNAEDVVKRVLQVNDRKAVDFIDLGVGTPRKDEALLEQIVSQSEEGSIVTFFPVDISFPLMELTLRRVLLQERDVLRPKERGITLRTKPLLGDFELLNLTRYQTFLRGHNARLFCLLGNTFGNLFERQTLGTLSGIMEERDFLLVDTEFLDDVENKELGKQYETQAMYDFVSHPLWLLEPRLEGLKRGNVSSMNVEVLQERDPIARFKFRSRSRDGKLQRLHRAARAEERLSDVSDSKVVAMYHVEHSDNKLLMAWSTKYRKPSLEAFLSEFFDICHSWLRNRYGMYLLKKPR